MNIRHEGNKQIMTESIVCVNYWDMKHYGDGFEKIGDNEYKCVTCGTVLTIGNPVLVMDEKNRLKMQVTVEQKDA